MKMQDYFSVVPWLTEEEKALGLGLLRKFRRHAIRGGAGDSPELTMDFVTKIIDWFYLQRMRTAAVEGAIALRSSVAGDPNPQALAAVDTLANQVLKIRASLHQEEVQSGSESSVAEPSPAAAAAPEQDAGSDDSVPPSGEANQATDTCPQHGEESTETASDGHSAASPGVSGLAGAAVA